MKKMLGIYSFSRNIYEMKKLRAQYSMESMNDKSIIEPVHGRSYVRLHGWGRDPIITSSTVGTTQNSKCLTYDELVNELQTFNGKYAFMEKKLIESNIMSSLTASTPRQSQSNTVDGDESVDE